MLLRLKICAFTLILMSITQCTSGNIIPSTPTKMYKTTDKILFTSRTGSGWELFTVDSVGTNLTQITKLNNLIGAFDWSPDGQAIAFTTFPEGFGDTLLLNVMNPDGSDIHEITDNLSRGFYWSPDSKQLAYVSKRSGLGELYLIDRNGSDEKQLTHGDPNIWANDVYDASWSPDGKQIAFIRPYRVFIINTDGTGENGITAEQNSATAVAWSPDNKRLGFVMDNRQETAIYTMLPDGSGVQKIATIPSSFTDLEWSPDGQHLFYTQKNNGIVSLFVVDADGKNNYQLANNIRGASWSPDSKHIVFSQYNKSLKSTLYIIDFDGKNQKLLPGNNNSDHSPVWSPSQ